MTVGALVVCYVTDCWLNNHLTMFCIINSNSLSFGRNWECIVSVESLPIALSKTCYHQPMSTNLTNNVLLITGFPQTYIVMSRFGDITRIISSSYVNILAKCLTVPKNKVNLLIQ